MGPSDIAQYTDERCPATGSLTRFSEGPNGLRPVRIKREMERATPGRGKRERERERRLSGNFALPGRQGVGGKQ